MAQPKPTTAYYLKYGAITPADTAESLTPVFIGPRYAVHNATYSNSVVAGASITSGGSGATVAWPNQTSGAIIDLATAAVYVTDPVVDLGNASGASLNTEVTASGSAIVFDGAIAGSGTILQGGYSLRRGDELTTDGGAILTVMSVGGAAAPTAEMKNGSGSAATGTWNAAYTGNTLATYMLTALAAGTASGGSMRITNVVGDIGFAPTNQWIGANVENDIGTLGASIAPISTTIGGALVSSGAVFFLQCTPAGQGAQNTAYVNADVESGTVIEYVRTSNAFPVTSAVLRGGDYTATDENIVIDSAVECIVNGELYPVVSGGVAVEYRELLTDDVNELQAGNANGILDWVGPQVPENPLGEAYKAAIQTGYNGFYLMATNGNSDAAYAAAIAAAGKVEDAYSLVPIYQDSATITAALATVAQYSAPTVAQPKRLWVYSQLQQNSTLLPNTDYPTVIGTVTAGNTTISNITAGALDAAGITKGDTVVIKDAYDATTQTYGDVTVTIKSVTSNSVTLTAAPTAGGTCALVFKRMLSASQLAQAIAAEARSYDNLRVNYVYAEPNTVAGDSFEDAQYILPVLATLRNQLAPHAPLTDVPIPGVSIGTGIGFSEPDLDLMNEAGVWICYRDGRGEMVTRHAITTGGVDTIAEEDSAVSNGDNILRTIRNSISWLRGNCNVTPALINQIYVNVAHAIDRIQGRNYDALIGPQILNVESIDVKQDPNNSAGVIGTFNLDLPAPYLDGNFTVNLF